MMCATRRLNICLLNLCRHTCEHYATALYEIHLNNIIFLVLFYNITLYFAIATCDVFLKYYSRTQN